MQTPAAPSDSPRTYRVGTLAYTRGSLLQMMFWMLWGDFFFQIFNSVTPVMVPLQLRWEGASDTTIGFVASQSALLAFCLYPFIGTQSDRHRGRLGRRRPFLLWFTAPAVLSLLLLGAAKPAGAWLHRGLALLGAGGLTTAGCVIAWIVGSYVLWIFFNSYMGQVYQFLFADVVPKEVMGRFFGFYRAIGAIGNLAFNRWALGWAEAHTLHVYCVIGLLYAFAFYMIVWRVKEGEYPPPPPRAAGGIAAVARYFRESFTNRFYLTFYCVSFFYWGSLVPLNFIVFFATAAGRPGYAPTLGLSLREFGDMKGWTFLIQIPVFFLIGPLSDRFHPIRVCIAGMFLTTVSYLACFGLIHDSNSLLLWWALNQGAIAVFLGAVAALTPEVLPRERYGQIFSANQTFGYMSLIATPPLCGYLLGTIRDYRYVFIFCGAFTALALVSLVTLFRQWKKLGGDRDFAPPAVGAGS